MNEPLYAGFWRRLVAAILDQIVLTVGRALIFGAMGGILYALLHLFEAQYNALAVFSVFGGIVLLLNFWLTWIYFALFESASLQGTPGKLALGIRVAHKENRPLTFEEATVRYFSKILSRITILIGYIMCAFSSRKQALHDFIARAVLTVDRR